MRDSYVESLVEEWDEVYKKGQLTFWVLLAIYDGKKYAAEISQFMYDETNGSFEVYEQSLYRALRRIKAAGMVRVSEEASPSSGPKRKYYSLTNVGETVLADFVTQHIAPLTKPKIASLLSRVQQKAKRRSHL